MSHNPALAKKREKALRLRLSRAKKPLELIIGTTNYRKEHLARELGKIGKITGLYSFIPYIAVRCDAGDANKLAKHINGEGRFYKELSTITSVELSNRFSIPEPKKLVKVEDRCSELWNLEVTGSYEAQEYSKGENALVAVIDTGASYTHPEIRDRFDKKKGYDFVDNRDDPVDYSGHGTHVSGTISGVNCGVAPGATLYALKVLNARGEGSEADVLSALEWCIKNSMDIANMSLGAPLASSAFEEMCAYAANQGLLMVAAAGNDGERTARYPAAFGASVIGVAATDRTNNHAYFSNIWPTNDISAPGVDIISCYKDGYAVLDGTSMSAPHVTGALSLAVSYAKSADFEEVLERTAEDVEPGLPDKNEVFGAGLLRADLLMKELIRSQRILSAIKDKKSLAGIIKNIFW